MKTYIVILHYGDFGITKKCIENILAIEKKFEKIILVNNNTENLSPGEVGNLKKVYVINNRKNLGFAAGVNVGIRYALKEKAEYILLLNNDTSLQKSIVDPLVMFLNENKEAGIAGPAIEFVNRQGKVVYDIGGSVNLIIGRTQHDEIKKIFNTAPTKVTYISGCCVLIRADVFKTVGYFDEQFFLYYEDVDFALRTKEKGFTSFVLPNVVLHHELSKTIGKLSSFAVYHQTKSGMQFGKKYCKVIFLNRIFLLLQSLKIFTKSPEAGKSAIKAMLQ